LAHVSPFYDLFVQLRRRGFLVGVEDYAALRRALGAAFGLSSKDSLRNLCCLLWAKSKSEREVLTSLFEQLPFDDWELEEVTDPDTPAAGGEPGDGPKLSGSAEPPAREVFERAPSTKPQRGLPPVAMDGVDLPPRAFVFATDFPLAPRAVAQTWKRLSGAVRSGPPEEIDVNATVALRCRQGVPGPVVLMPRRRKHSRVLLLVDEQGSMAPFQKFTELVWDAIKRSDRSRGVAVYHFHDVPAEGADSSVLAAVSGWPFPVLNDIPGEVPPSGGGYVYADRELLAPVPLPAVLRAASGEAGAILLSDAGAARRRYDPQRLLDTVAFLKALRGHTRRCIWLNPLPVASWKGTTAEEIAHHVPMFELDERGLRQALGVLRGRRPRVENSL
jgi:hypothetical protein